MNYMFLPLKRYADFNGRSRRMEYWMFVLFQVIVFVVLEVILGMLFASNMPSAGSVGPDGTMDPAAATAMMTSMGPMFLILMIVALALFIPSLAVTVRRLHDQDKSGWFVLLPLIPLVGGIILFVFTLLPGTVGPNRYGEDPKEFAA